MVSLSISAFSSFAANALGLMINAALLVNPVTAQYRGLPSISFDKAPNRYTAHLDSVLGISGKNVIVIAWTVTAYPSLPSRTHYVVYPAKGRVTLYNSNNRIASPLNSDLEKVTLDRKVSNEFRQLLWSAYDSTGFKVRGDSLNLTSEAGDRGAVIQVSDGPHYLFWIWGSGGLSNYNTYAPDVYIRSKYPGWSQRERLMWLWKGYATKVKEIREMK